ncbi:MAG TPA: hypothetical protein IAD49_06825 [Candidatus Fimihabitans intestinipullorum]|mgnify:FL=1|uniref:Uncharacterized protein n=1 Tax=Candidatus Fimihabitans intestinipullorum TaxID=2840820 RepID=A0A9D1L357_9BACT|nr:hypothetical protein [Candidatus Fimihabitans intestinipullorum]
MDIEKWFKEGTGFDIQELRYLSPPGIPYNIYLDSIDFEGADQKNNIKIHNITIEHYDNKANTSSEKAIDQFFNKKNIKFEKSREWLNDDKLWVTIYDLEPVFEKMKGE